MVLRDPPVSGHPVTFREHHKIAAHHLAPGDALAHSRADDQRPRAGQIAQRFQRSFGARFLDNRDDDRKPGKRHQDQRFLKVAQGHVDQAGPDQHRQHGFAQDIGDDAGKRALPATRQLVVAFCPQACGSFGVVQAGQIRSGPACLLPRYFRIRHHAWASLPTGIFGLDLELRRVTASRSWPVRVRGCEHPDGVEHVLPCCRARLAGPTPDALRLERSVAAPDNGMITVRHPADNKGDGGNPSSPMTH